MILIVDTLTASEKYSVSKPLFKSKSNFSNIGSVVSSMKSEVERELLKPTGTN